MRVYPSGSDFTIAKLMEDCTVRSNSADNPFASSPKSKEIDIKLLNERLRDLPVTEIRERRFLLEEFYQEILLSARRNDHTIGFTDFLMTLAHYKIIDKKKSLRLEEFLRRQARLGIVKDEVRRKIVKDFISTIYHRSRYIRDQDTKRASRLTTIPQLQVPEIFVEDEDDSDRASSRASGRPRPTLTLTIPPQDDMAFRASGTDARETPTSPGLRNRTESFSPRESPTRPSISPTRPSFQSQHSIQISPQLSPWRTTSQPPSPLDFPPGDGILSGAGRIDDRRSLSPVGGATDRLSVRRSGSTRRSTSTQDVLDVLEDSAWGESMRRSMTAVRRGTRASSAVSRTSAGSGGRPGSAGKGGDGA